MSDSIPACISLCPDGIGIRDHQGYRLLPRARTKEPPLPDLEGITAAYCIYLPIEELLVRHFNLPLQHTRFLDAHMLAQELADIAGIEPEDWWLSWHATSHEQGVSGLVFALPQTYKQHMQHHEPWQSAPWILIDVWARLNHLLPPDAHDTAVIDTDAEGVFFGFYQNGGWRGMRRLNANMQDADIGQQITQDIILSLHAMGFDSEQHHICGNIASGMQHDAWAEHTDITVSDTLQPRHIQTLKLPQPDKQNHTLNLRHGSWSAKRKVRIPKAWQRSAYLALAVTLLWLGSLAVENHRLQSRIHTMNDEIIRAFHRGLPEQTVIIDAMAQLRQAAQGSTGSRKASASSTLNIISQVFQKYPWHMQELRISDKEVVMAGKVDKLEQLNQISTALQEALGRDVKITDTDLQGNEVRFRMRWS